MYGYLSNYLVDFHEIWYVQSVFGFHARFFIQQYNGQCIDCMCLHVILFRHTAYVYSAIFSIALAWFLLYFKTQIP
jgi:ABC-type uncharacterized transport system permease subunit